MNKVRRKKQNNAFKVKKRYITMADNKNPEITVVVRLIFKTSFWDALKMRLVGTEFIRRYFEKNIKK